MSARPAFDRLVAATVQRDVLVVTGPEAAPYLHGQISADVKAMEIGQSTLSFLLEPRGRIEAFFAISRVGLDTFVADTDAGFGEAMTMSLERFKLRTEAAFSLQRRTMHAVRGPAAAPEANSGASATGSADAPEHVVRPAHWPLTSGYDLLVNPGSTVSDTAQDAEQVSADEFEALRMAYGLPAMGTEIRPGDIPNETGLVERAASFTKGCYRGQELVERIDSRAGGRRSICRFRAAGDVAVGEGLRGADGAVIGTVLSAASLAAAVVGYALVQRNAAGPVISDGGKPVELGGLF